MFFGLGYLLNQGVLGRGRVSMLGVHMGTVLRYQLENVVLLGIALAVALPVLLCAVRHRIPDGRSWRLAATAVVAALVAAVALPWSHAVRAEVSLSAGAATRSYVDDLHASYEDLQQSDPELGFLAGDTVPNWLVYGAMAPYNQLDRVLPQVLPGARFTSDDEQVLTISDEGTVRPASFTPVSDVPVSGQCLSGAGASSTRTVGLDRPLPEGRGRSVSGIARTPSVRRP